MEDLYREKHRPRFHFSAGHGWINDPNGLVYYKGEYHLFFQHNPYGCKWGNMHWGHAVSRDLIHWNELGEALYPDEDGTMFSGSGVVDANNTSGLKCGAEDPVILFYTAAGGTSEQSKGKPFTQCMAYSNDRCRTWTKYRGNPVIGKIENGSRDPKVIWHEQTGRWIMALYIGGEEYAVFTSGDLKKWSMGECCRIPGTGECPDLFELPVDGNMENRKWVFWSANGSYLIGSFDGRSFTEEDRVITNSSIKTGYSYAAQTWSNIPADDGRTIQISWATIDMPDMPFNGCMTFPRELSLRTTDEGIRLFAGPVREIESIHGHRYEWENRVISDRLALTGDIYDECVDICSEIDPGSAEKVIIDIHGVKLIYDNREGKLFCMDQCALLKPEQGKLRLRILADRSIVEIFGNGGMVYMPVGTVGRYRHKPLQVFALRGEARIASMAISTIKGIWE